MYGAIDVNVGGADGGVAVVDVAVDAGVFDVVVGVVDVVVDGVVDVADV